MNDYEDDPAAHDLLRNVFERADEWQKRTNEPPRELQKGSELAGDDEATDYLQLSHVALGSLTSAVDHLYALRVLVGTPPGFLPANASFTLARGAHENAAVAVWLLSPEDRVERVRRRLSLALQDSYNANEIRRAVGENDLHDQRKADIAERASRVGLTMEDLGRFPGYENVITDSGAWLGDATLHTVLWKGCSGLAHGMQWSSMALLRRETFEVDGQVVTLRLTTGLSTIASAAWHASLMIKEGFRLLDHRRLVFR